MAGRVEEDMGGRPPRSRLWPPLFPHPSKPNNGFQRPHLQPLTDGETKTGREKVRCPRSNSQQVAEPINLN